MSPHLLPRPSDWPDRVRLTGPWIGDGHHVADDSISRFVHRGVFVCMGFGPMSDDHAEGRARALIGGARAASLRVVCATGWGGLSVHADLRGDDLLVFDDAPHDYLFCRPAAVIHHGDAGTVHAAARAGVPQLVVPFFGDQPSGRPSCCQDRAGSPTAGSSPGSERQRSPETSKNSTRSARGHAPRLKAWRGSRGPPCS